MKHISLKFKLSKFLEINSLNKIFTNLNLLLHLNYLQKYYFQYMNYYYSNYHFHSLFLLNKEVNENNKKLLNEITKIYTKLSKNLNDFQI